MASKYSRRRVRRHMRTMLRQLLGPVRNVAKAKEAFLVEADLGRSQVSVEPSS